MIAFTNPINGASMNPKIDLKTPENPELKKLRPEPELNKNISPAITPPIMMTAIASKAIFPARLDIHSNILFGDTYSSVLLCKEDTAPLEVK